MIYYLLNEVTYTSPVSAVLDDSGNIITPAQTDYEVLIQIKIAVVNGDGSFQNPVLYRQTLTGYTSQDGATLAYELIRPTLSDSFLEQYAINNASS